MIPNIDCCVHVRILLQNKPDHPLYEAINAYFEAKGGEAFDADGVADDICNNSLRACSSSTSKESAGPRRSDRQQSRAATGLPLCYQSARVASTGAGGSAPARRPLLKESTAKRIRRHASLAERESASTAADSSDVGDRASEVDNDGDGGESSAGADDGASASSRGGIGGGIRSTEDTAGHNRFKRISRSRFESEVSKLLRFVGRTRVSATACHPPLYPDSSHLALHLWPPMHCRRSVAMQEKESAARADTNTLLHGTLRNLNALAAGMAQRYGIPLPQPQQCG